MTDCDDCEDPLQDPRDKNMSGWWRDRCLPCIRQEHSRAMTDGGWNQTDRFRFHITVEETDDDRYRAFEQASDRELYGRGPTPPSAVARYLALVSDRVSVRVDGGETDA